MIIVVIESMIIPIISNETFFYEWAKIVIADTVIACFDWCWHAAIELLIGGANEFNWQAISETNFY